MKHNRSEICMPSPFHTNDKTIIVDNYDNALGIIKQKLYDGDYFTSTDSLINTQEFLLAAAWGLGCWQHL
ncbi:MAG: hypothetical protein WCC17_10260 [Candidatus Nitrosopolaris sp.]